MSESDSLPYITDTLSRIDDDAHRLRLFVQGKDNETVLLGDIDTPTLRNLVASMQKEQKALVDEYTNTKEGLVAFVTKQANIATQSADKSADQIQKAIKVSEQIYNAIKNIDGFARATQAFHGIKVDEDMKLLWIKGEDGESFDPKDFLFSAILPTESRIFLDNGQLFVELPFTQ